MKTRVGIDLDGILIPDIPNCLYDYDIEYALEVRDNKDIFSFIKIPYFYNDYVEKIIITARPVIDLPRTMKKIEVIKDRFSDIHFRNFDFNCIEDKNFQAARYKFNTSIKLGIKEFYESDLDQAKIISSFSGGKIKIIHWNNDINVRIIIH